MPSYLDFDSTKKFRDFIISKTINHPDGPQTFTSDNYNVSTISSFANIDQPSVDESRTNDLLTAQKSNIYKPTEFFIKENLETLPRRENLSLYPYFTQKPHTLIGIMTNNDYSNESELFKFAAYHIKNNKSGPIFSRVEQNLNRAINGRIRILDAINGNTSTAINIATGKEPIIDYNYSITTAKTGIGKAIDFLQVASGVEFPWSEIPGDYLSNPLHEINYKPEASTEVGKMIQDTTGAIGSLLGIQRRTSSTRKPSDLMIEYLGEGQKQQLYRQLSYSKYAPNYTTTARSQNTSKVFNFIDNLTQGAKNLLGTEAPAGISYIGDDRGNDVKFAMGDFNDRQVRSPYYLSLMFDETAAKTFQNEKNFSEGGNSNGSLTWISSNSRNNLGSGNSEWEKDSSYFNTSLSTKHTFREGSILGYTQEILNSMPTNGGESRSHIANVIDQTSRFFKDGDKIISRGSAVQYVDKYGNGSGVEYSRVWTKDRPYLKYSDLMKKSGGIRKFGSSIVNNTYNLNIAPLSDGNKDFGASTNIQKNEKYYPGEHSVKKYMFSLENLVWKNSRSFGKTAQDLPYSERGPNGGRIMWFPPYDLSISEQNNANWETNKFIGRPEPIYTYQGTERNASLSFRIVVDHPSILNLLVREAFKNMSDEESENYINAFFAGAKDVDFYSLIQTYPMLDKSDLDAILKYINKTGNSPTGLKDSDQIGVTAGKIPISTASGKLQSKREFKGIFYFPDSLPSNASNTYKGVYDTKMGNDTFRSEIKDGYLTLITNLLTNNNFETKSKREHDTNLIWKTTSLKTEEKAGAIQIQSQSVDALFNEVDNSYSGYVNILSDIKQRLSGNTITDITVRIDSSTTITDTEEKNLIISNNRTWSMINDIINEIKLPNSSVSTNPSQSGTTLTIPFKDLGYENSEGGITFKYKNLGEKSKEIILDKTPSQWAFAIQNLHKISPISFLIRKSNVIINYTIKNNEQNNNTPSGVVNTSLINNKNEKPEPAPSLNQMKRTIMKTLQESFYFKKLEETDPVVFKTLKEKLRYFHPGFHSTTPEGLNSRLTFLHQCIRPGETIPIKDSDGSTVARNTTFGPPPICVLRIGDFYHSKVIIKDLNITFDENMWDLNPEGIGMQPMIAKVTMQLSFIGGQGLEKPIARLQNALSSNFYANTEMYDERSESSGGMISGMEEEKFTKEFLEGVVKTYEADKSIIDENRVKGNVTMDAYIGKELDETSLSYEHLIKNLYMKISDYEIAYQKAYNDVTVKNGKKLASLIFSTKYREITEYDVYSDTGTIGKTINIFGVYRKKLSEFTSKIATESETLIKAVENTSSILGLENIIPPNNIKTFNSNLQTFLIKTIKESLTSLESNPSVKGLEKTRPSLINSLDKLNFLVNYGYDVKIKNSLVEKASLSGFTGSSFYGVYQSYVNNLGENFVTFNSDVDTTFDIIKNSLTIDDVKEILKVILSIDKVKDLYSGADRSTIKLSIESKLSNFIENIKIKTFKAKVSSAPSTATISHVVTGTETITDVNIIADATKLFSDNVVITNKLNYYKK